MATAYHMEALRKQRIIERKQEAACRLAAKQQGIPVSEISGTNMATHGGSPQDLMNVMSDHRQSENHRLHRFRVNEEGFRNRYRNREQFAPHVDNIYKVLYTNDNNDDYVADECRNNRRQNKYVDKYEAEKALNGELHILAQDTPDI